ncbi:MAG: tyrosine--tRNA ligase, partial [Chloroflexota bacterium]|nr:tyrosine--tRNA ligase [Chloroflexota bacterium]
LAHGREAAEQAQATTQSLFAPRTLTRTVEASAALSEHPTVEVTSQVTLAAEVAFPTTEIARERLETGIPAVDLLIEAGLAESKNRARQLIEQGGAYLNDERLESRTVTAADLRDGALLLRAGKKRYQRVIPT